MLGKSISRTSDMTEALLHNTDDCKVKSSQGAAIEKQEAIDFAATLALETDYDSDKQGLRE